MFTFLDFLFLVFDETDIGAFCQDMLPIVVR